MNGPTVIHFSFTELVQSTAIHVGIRSKMLFLVLLAILFCPHNPDAVKVTWVRSPNHSPRIDRSTGRTVKPTILVQHYTASSLKDTFKTFQTKGTVSSHYTVAANGSIYQHVDEKDRAWHAGKGRWRDVTDVNTYSIGIEIENLGFREKSSQPRGTKVKGSNREWYKFTKEQIKSVIELSSEIVRRYKIEPRNVIGHSDLAPGRKQDPGPLFPWKQLAKEGIGATVGGGLKGTNTNVKDVQKKLHNYGYTMVPQNGRDDKETKAVLVSFQMHFRQGNISGAIDAETMGILDALLKRYVPPKKN